MTELKQNEGMANNRKIVKVIWREVSSIPRIICIFFLCLHRKYIFIQSWCKIKPFASFREDPLYHNNWGDDINYYFLQKIIGRKIVFYPRSRIAGVLPIKRYIFIGSTITFFSLKKSVICGSGIINENEKNKIKGIPQKIISVRGPLTRQVLLDKGYDCPPKYGDLALLMPIYYKPKVFPKWKIGVVPHYSDICAPVVQRISNKEYTDIHMINIRDYEKWTDIIDEICNCELVLSSSLHGLIVAETYGIPCSWIYLSDYDEGWDFKFKDFYCSIRKEKEKPIVINTYEEIIDLYWQKEKWKKGMIDYDGINDAFLDGLKNI